MSMNNLKATLSSSLLNSFSYSVNNQPVLALMASNTAILSKLRDVKKVLLLVLQDSLSRSMERLSFGVGAAAEFQLWNLHPGN